MVLKSNQFFIKCQKLRQQTHRSLSLEEKSLGLQDRPVSYPRRLGQTPQADRVICMSEEEKQFEEAIDKLDQRDQ